MEPGKEGAMKALWRLGCRHMSGGGGGGGGTGGGDFLPPIKWLLPLSLSSSSSSWLKVMAATFGPEDLLDAPDHPTHFLPIIIFLLLLL